MRKITFNKKKEAPCQCITHLVTDKMQAIPLKCLGHGKGCPCWEALQNEQK